MSKTEHVDKINNKADLIFMNGFIYTADEHETIAEAVAIKDSRITYVGANKEVEAWIGVHTEVIDLNGKMVLPSFFEAHGHASAMVELIYSVNMNEKESLAEYIDIISIFLKNTPNCKCITGNGWTNTIFPPEGPLKEDLDAISKNIPIALWSEDHHSLWVNSKALEMAQITQNTQNPKGGIIEKDKFGEPTGTLREHAADLVMKAIPSFTVEQYKNAILAYQEMAVSLGITGCFDPLLNQGSNAIKAYKELSTSKDLKMYFRGAYAYDSDKDIEQLKELSISRLKDNEGELFQINAIKIFKDGVVEGGTAYLLNPYADGAGKPEGYRGEPIWSLDMLNEIFIEAEKNCFQIHVHAIGDAATKETLQSFKHSAIKNRKKDSRHSITHLQLVDPKDIMQFKELGIIGVANPYWFVKDDYFYNLQMPYLGYEKAEKEYPFNSFVREGVIIASASDFPVTILPNPLMGIQVGVTRTVPCDSDSREPLWPQESASLEYMIKSFTYNGAYANFLDKETGSIEVGKSADLIVMDQNLFEVDITEISNLNVLLTIFKGKEVFRHDAFMAAFEA